MYALIHLAVSLFLTFACQATPYNANLRGGTIYRFWYVSSLVHFLETALQSVYYINFTNEYAQAME